MHDCFIGIDVAFAKRKRLPMVVCAWEGERLVPYPLRTIPIEPPRGFGNVSAVDLASVLGFAEGAKEYILRICEYFGTTPVRIAIDAPSSPTSEGLRRRAAEKAMDEAGISCFTTPSEDQWLKIRERVADHLAAGGAHSRLPHANQLWMLPGFQLFKTLNKVAPCLKVFPQAIARELGVGGVHKSKREGVTAQIRSAARYTGWPAGAQEEAILSKIAWAPRHDCLDAYLSAWVAALEEHERVPYGIPPGDVIWVPKCGALRQRINCA